MPVLPSQKGPGPDDHEEPRRGPASQEEPERPGAHPGPLPTKVGGALGNHAVPGGLQQLHSKSCLSLFDVHMVSAGERWERALGYGRQREV